MSPREIASIVWDEDGNIYVYEVEQVTDCRNETYRVAREVIEVRKTSAAAAKFKVAIQYRDAEGLRDLIVGAAGIGHLKTLRKSDKVMVTHNSNFEKDANHLPPNLLTGGVSLVAVGNSNFPVVVRQVLFMAEQYAREQNPEVFRFPGSRAECNVVGVELLIVQPTLTAGFMLGPPVRLDDEHYQTGNIVWTVATLVTPDNSLGAAAVRYWEEKLADAEAKGDEDTAARLRRDLEKLWEELRKPPILRANVNY